MSTIFHWPRPFVFVVFRFEKARARGILIINIIGSLVTINKCEKRHLEKRWYDVFACRQKRCAYGAMCAFGTLRIMFVIASVNKGTPYCSRGDIRTVPFNRLNKKHTRNSGTFLMFYRYFLKIVCRATMASRLPPSAASRRYFSARAISLFTPKPLK